MNKKVKSRIFRKSSMKFTLGLDDCRIARNVPRLELLIVNNSLERSFGNGDYSMSKSMNLSKSKISFLRQ